MTEADIATDLRAFLTIFGLPMLVMCALLLPRRKRGNRRVSRSAWPRKGTTAPTGYFADSAKRPGPECAGKVG